MMAKFYIYFFMVCVYAHAMLRVWQLVKDVQNTHIPNLFILPVNCVDK